MRCPYCGEDIKDDALLCKHCHQLLLGLNKPLVEQNRELVTKITELQSDLANVRAEYERLQSNLYHSEAAQRVAYWSVISYCARFVLLPILLLLLAHYLIIVKLDLKVMDLRLVSILVPFLFGFGMLQQNRQGVGEAMIVGLVGCAIGVTAVAGMNLVMHWVYGDSIVPTRFRDWQESVEFSLSIALATVAGYALASILKRPASALGARASQNNAVTRWFAQKVGLPGGKTLSEQIDFLDRFARVATVAVSAAGSIFYGLRLVL